MATIQENVKEYYGKILQKSADLKTNACCPLGIKFPAHVKKALSLIHEDVQNKYYGCGLVIPESLEGMKVLDLGSGSGQDCFVLSHLVGESGHVTGVDMTDEQLETANSYIQYHTEKFGYEKPNVHFVKSYIENLNEAGLKDGTFDIIVSNCVVNLSPDKRAVLAEACRVLKEGGELYFSDVYADRELSPEIRTHKVLWGECIAGALCWTELVSLAEQVGFSKPRLVTAKPMLIEKPELSKVVGDARFVSATYRLFKIGQTIQDSREVIYEGTIPECPEEVQFDCKHHFKVNEVHTVDEELSTILQISRFQDDFSFQPPSKRTSSHTCCPGQGVVIDPFEYLKMNKIQISDSCCKTVQNCC